MAVLLQIVAETIVITLFLWIGKSVMKAQVSLLTLGITALAGSLASQVPYLGNYLSFGVVLFFLWKMARVDVVPDGYSMVVIGKGAGLIIMIYVFAFAAEHLKEENTGTVNQIPIYSDQSGTRYYADGKQMYFINENGEKVLVEADTILGISEMMEVANGQDPGNEPVQDASAIHLTDLAEKKKPESDPAREMNSLVETFPAKGFSEPFLSDSVVRGELVPFELFVAKGWKIFQRAGELAVRFENHTYLRCYAHESGSENNAYLREEVTRVLSLYPGYDVAKQEIVTIDGKKWAQIQMANKNGDQILLVTHADRLGCYSIQLNGSHKQLSSQKELLNRMIFSFNFPPSTYFLAQLEGKE